jgi:hypothetical protein
MDQPLFNRRDLVRAAVLAGAATALGPALSFAQSIAAGLTPAALGEDGTAFLTNPNWKAAFLNDHQNETLIALSEVIIPATDTPGAKEALVNRFIDLLISVQPPEFQKKFADALGSMDSASQEQYGKEFVSLPVGDQVALLTPWAYTSRASRWTDEEAKPNLAQQHFELLKALIADSYYGSEIGETELGWGDGSEPELYNDCGGTGREPRPRSTATHKLIHK